MSRNSSKPDPLWDLIARLRLHFPHITDAQWLAIEAETRAELGGLRVRIPKRRKHPTEEERARVVHEALNSSASDEELTLRHGISRSSLYRYIKRGTQ